MKRFSRALIAVLLLFALSGCFEKEFENNPIVLRGAKNLNFSVGETKTLTAELPELEGVKLTPISRDPALNATLSDDNTLALASNAAGEYILTLRLEAKGYRTKEVRYPVTVTVRSMQITLAWQDGSALDLSQELALDPGDEKILVLSGVPENAVYDMQNTDPTVVSARQENGDIKLTAVSPGTAALQIDVTCDGYEPFSLSLPVEITKPEALLELGTQSVSGTTQDTLKVTCLAFQPGGHLLATAEDPAVSVEVDGNIIRIAATKAGNFTVLVSCEAENYQTATQTIKAAFTSPLVPLSLPASISLSLGQTKEVNIADLPDGAKLSLAVTNDNIGVQNKDNVLSIEGKSVGSANITIIASCEGYTDSRVTLSVTVGAISYSASSKYDSYVKEIVALVNEERTDRGLSMLTYLPELAGACQTRAKEASSVWAHTRPDGRSWETVLADMSYDYHAAGENLLDANVLDAAKAVEAWMNSDDHRENILRETFTGICVGIVQGDDGNYYYSQLFITKE